ncbi:GroES-like protein [Epithele typhae]|uniref:GroES-like protein n=1 Tax=Epithele typhae TaxID=378194 RepID=UPI002008E740|nr:GroES-like protein [Epithele typhae]KAH9940398.1 GroES-like protein [Epithele typhae]
MSSQQTQFKGYAVIADPKDLKKPWTNSQVIDYKPKAFEADDVEIAITHCGVCGSDVHTLTQDRGESKVPLVVGHEIAGRVTRVGDNAKDIQIGDLVGVGAQRASCLKCRACQDGFENYCLEAIDTYGGYSTAIRAHQRFVFPIPKEIEPRHAASMMCAGLTVYSPLKTHGCAPGKTVGVMGISGLGHYAVMFAKAMGAKVIAFTDDKSKLDEIKEMRADEVINTKDNEYWKDYPQALDILISTRDVPSDNTPLGDFLSMLYVHGCFITVGIPYIKDPLPPVHAFNLVPNGCFVGSSKIGSKEDCLEMLELVRSKGIKPRIEELPMKDAANALQNLRDNKVRYRQVLTQDLQ